jgi:hypothetical protein
MTDPLIEHRWYWVRNSSDNEWFPACRMSQMCGGWCNQDTWEDWNREVTEWRLIPLPDKS